MHQFNLTNRRRHFVGGVDAARVVSSARWSLLLGAGPFRITGQAPLGRVKAVARIQGIVANCNVTDHFDVVNRKGHIVFQFTRVADKEPLYKNPFRAAKISAMRIDAGVDYTGSGKVFPIGKARIVNRGTPSGTWSFGNDMPVYELLGGPRKGQFIYMDEHMKVLPGVKTGDVVSVDTPIWELDGPVEIGWSDGVGSWAWRKTNYSEGELSECGTNMSEFLFQLGAPRGLTMGRGITNKGLPPGMPV